MDASPVCHTRGVVKTQSKASPAAQGLGSLVMAWGLPSLLRFWNWELWTVCKFIDAFEMSPYGRGGRELKRQGIFIWLWLIRIIVSPPGATMSIMQVKAGTKPFPLE